MISIRLTGPLCIASIMLATSCAKVEPEDTNVENSVKLEVQGEYEALNNREPLNHEAINRLVEDKLYSQGEFRWDMVDSYTAWSAASVSDSLYSIGYAPVGVQDLEDKIHLIDFESGPWADVKVALTNWIIAETNKISEKQVTKEDIFAFGDKKLPYINVQIASYDILAKLQRMNVVRYCEPMGYEADLANEDRSGSGCGSGGPASYIPSSDYTTVSPNAKVSWNYYEHNIPAAWAQSQGDNIGVGVIDTGLDPNQPKMNSQFSSGQSTGRWRNAIGTYEYCWWWWCWDDGPNDECGHGTAMAGTVAAPRTGDGSTVGVAYKSNLVSVRASTDVIVNSSSEKDGVSDAYYNLANNSNIKIISMSMGDVFYSGQVADAVRYANNRGKLIFNAAGTSLSWTSWWGVIFPANMSETVAVTGVRTGLPLQRCDVCHDGSQVDFIVTMQDRNNTNRTPLTIATSTNTPSYSGGSSIATATTAGIAALAWAKNPSASKTTVLNALKSASSIYPSRDGNFGWGAIDALEAVEAMP